MPAHLSLSMETFGQQSPVPTPDVVPIDLSLSRTASLLVTAPPPSLATEDYGSDFSAGEETVVGEDQITKKSPAVVIDPIDCSFKSRVLSTLGWMCCFYPQNDADDESWFGCKGQTFPPQWKLDDLASAHESSHVFPNQWSSPSETTISSSAPRPSSGIYMTARDDSSSQVSIASATTAPSFVEESRAIEHMKFLGYKDSMFRIDKEAKLHQTTMHVFLTDMDEGRLLPVEATNAKNILDIGTGTGDWALDVADANPKATVIGTDIAAIQRTSYLGNVTFYVDDANKTDWAWGHRFNFVHIRGLNGGIKSWAATLREVASCLHAGGVTEISDMVWRPPNPPIPGSVWFDWYKMFKFLTNAKGLDVDLYENNRAQGELEKLGLEVLFYSSRKHSVGYKTHIYDDRRVLVCVVEQMKGALARATEVVPWPVNLGSLMHRLETEIFDKGVVIEVFKVIARKPAGQ
ncbi:methyltransferase domain-containing protein [Verticillium dahliae]